MKRNKKHIKHLLDLVQAEANSEGVSTAFLVQKFLDTSGGHPVEKEDVRYAIFQAIDGGLLKSVKLSDFMEQGVQLTWIGHDYLDTENNKFRPA
jgi:hypothetical protein